MNEDDKELMAQYGITSVTKMVYCYKQYKYSNLADAVRYAMHDNNLGKRSDSILSTKAERAENNHRNV